MTIFSLTAAAIGARVDNLEAYRDPGGGLTGVIGFSLAAAGIVARRLLGTNLNGSSAIAASGNGVAVLDSVCQGSACSTGTYFASGGAGITFEGCADLTRSAGPSFTSSGSPGVRHVRCVVDGNGVNAVGFNTPVNSLAATYEHCVAYDTGASAGFAPYNNTVLDRCVAHTSGGFAANGSGAGNLMRSCASYSSTANSGPFESDEGFISLSADPFADAAGGDFSPNDVAGGGADLKGIAHAFPGLSTTGYRDAGAAQSQGGGGIYTRRVRTLGV
jgi:hypothetical protein